MGNQYYLTTPIYYVNGDPHIGHAHTSIMADIIKRQLSMQGKNVFLSTGVDEHGQKNQEELVRLGMDKTAYLDMQSRKFRTLFDRLNIGYDYFVRTSEDSHIRVVKEILTVLFKKGAIIKKEYTGLYCKGCEQFKTESDLDKEGLCPDHHIEPVMEKETNYFFPLEPYREYLIGFINENPMWIRPGIYRNKVLDMLKDPLRDLCVSRPKSRVHLGIELPFDPDYVTYVWFDALINYISNISWSAESGLLSPWWQHSYHLMAKDIIKTHCIYWPIMLKALGIPPASANIVHGFWIGEDGLKMSKSLGNGVDPQKIVDRYGVDCLRFFLASRMGRNESRIGTRLVHDFYVSVLSNLFGNTFLRCGKLLHKYNKGVIPDLHDMPVGDTEFLENIVKDLSGCPAREPDIENLSSSAKTVEDMGKRINKYLDDRAPWNLARNGDKRGELLHVLLVSCEATRLLFEYAYPFIPGTSDRVLSYFGLTPLAHAKEAHRFVLYRLVPGIRLKELELLFPKVEAVEMF